MSCRQEEYFVCSGEQLLRCNKPQQTVLVNSTPIAKQYHALWVLKKKKCHALCLLNECDEHDGDCVTELSKNQGRRESVP